MHRLQLLAMPLPLLIRHQLLLWMGQQRLPLVEVNADRDVGLDDNASGHDAVSLYVERGVGCTNGLLIPTVVANGRQLDVIAAVLD